MKLSCNIVTNGGHVTELLLQNSAGATVINIVDNTSKMMPTSYAGRFDSDCWQWITPKFMQAWIASGKDLQLRIDCINVDKSLQHVISEIELDVEDFSITDISGQQLPFYIVASPAINEEMLKASVEENAFAVSRAAEDNAGWPVSYYRAKTLTNIAVMNTYELKAIQGTDAVKMIKVFFPHTKVLSTLEFDQFGLKYNDITNLHILAETFHKTYNDVFARPAINDIVYIKFLDQYFEITDVEDIKTSTNKILYYDIKLQFITDRQRVAKDSDVLDLSGLINAESQADQFAIEHTQKDIVEFDKRIWSSQILQYAEQYETETTDNFVYGICYDNELGWCKFSISANDIAYFALTDTTYSVIRIDEVGTTLNVCKLAMFDNELSKFDMTMYYTSYIFPRTLQPLQLIEHQTSNID